MSTFRTTSSTPPSRLEDSPRRLLAGLLSLGGIYAAWGAIPTGDLLAAPPDPPVPASALEARPSGGVSGEGAILRADTLSFGNVDANGYAIEGDSWTWDHGNPDPLEGWSLVDVTAQERTFFRHIDAASWSGHDNPVTAPVLSGEGSAWLGAFQDEADSLCWDGGLGYGNSWNQRLESPVLTYAGSGDVALDFTYFLDTEPQYDYVYLYLRQDTGNEYPLTPDGLTGRAGYDGVNPPTGTGFSRTITEAEFAGTETFQIVFEMTSDGGWSDEDAHWETEYGPLALDDLSLSGAVAGGDLLYTFETDLEGWSPEAVGNGADMFIALRDDYEIEDDCACGLDGYVLAFHDEFGQQPYGRHVQAWSPPIDLSAIPYPKVIFADWDQYGELPLANGVFYRLGWSYYPFVCEATGEVGWSDRVGEDTYFFGGSPLCSFNRSVATDADVPVPMDAEQVRFIYEIFSSCDIFGVGDCTGETNFTPLIDNVVVKVTEHLDAPPISFEVGHRIRDGFSQTSRLSPYDPGNSDVDRNVNFGNIPPFVLGDSLLVQGPLPTSSTRWEAKLWFRVARKGPAQESIADYVAWRDRVSDGFDIEQGEWSWGRMDSAQIGTQVFRNKFVSYFREDDDDFVPGFELKKENEILPDLTFVPGTQIEYFATSNYVGSGQHYVLPDTTGGHWLEFEILPRFRDDGGVWKFPSVLYIDLRNRGAQHFYERALNVALHGAGPLDPLPDSPLWDRFDVGDAGCCWAAPFARGPGGTSGATLAQLLGYRAILVDTDDNGWAMWPEDAALLSDWTTAPSCGANSARQGIALVGDGAALTLHNVATAWFNTGLGATIDLSAGEYGSAGAYRLITGDDAYCVRIEDAAGSHYGPGAEYDVWGNGCPDEHDVRVLGVTSGVGSRVYENVATGEPTPFAQVTNEVLDPFEGNYRSLVAGYGWNQIATREAGDECSPEELRIIGAAATELEAFLGWVFDGPPPGLTDATCDPDPSDVVVEGGAGSGAVTRLYPVRPNPFNPRATVRYSLAADGPVRLEVFDASGRRVRTLVEGERAAGSHEVVWDGTDDGGRRLPAGVYWNRLEAGGRTSSARMVVLD